MNLNDANYTVILKTKLVIVDKSIGRSTTILCTRTLLIDHLGELEDAVIQSTDSDDESSIVAITVKPNK